VVTTRAIADSFATQEYFSTFGGNPVAMAAGLAVMEVVEVSTVSAVFSYLFCFAILCVIAF
jgi:4-aminobutyrate aminotransferase-like enzyme